MSIRSDYLYKTEYKLGIYTTTTARRDRSGRAIKKFERQTGLVTNFIRPVGGGISEFSLCSYVRF